MKTILLATAIVSQYFPVIAQSIQLPAFLRCREEVYGVVVSSRSQEVIRNDIDGTRFIAVVNGAKIYLGKVETPGLYNIKVDTVDSYHFVYSCRDTVAKPKPSEFPLRPIPLICNADGLCYTGVLDTLRKESRVRDTAFRAKVDTAGFALQALVKPGQTLKLGLFFDMANGHIGIIGSDQLMTPRRDTALTLIESFFGTLLTKLRPDSVASNSAMVALMKTAVEAAIPNTAEPGGGLLETSANFKYAPSVIDDLYSTYTKRWVEGNMQAVALGFESKYSGQMVLLMSIARPPEPKPQ